MALQLNDGDAPGEAILRGLAEEMTLRAGIAGAGGDWTAPHFTNLRISKRTPDWWTARGNVLLCAADAREVTLQPDLAHPPPRQSAVIVGAGVQVSRVHASGTNAFVAVGDASNLYAARLCAGDQSTLVVGCKTISTFDARLDVRNGGAILIGAGGLLATGVTIITDDMHAIRDVRTNRRLNARGGRVIIGQHVWIGEQAQIFGGVRIGRDCIVGAGSFVRNISIPANAVCVGRPARIVRRGITWTLDDEP